MFDAKVQEHIHPVAPPLAVSGLSKVLAGGRQLLCKLDLTLQAGEIVAIMGESGIGKSTLLNLIAGLDTPDQGCVRLGDKIMSLADDNARALLRRDHIGFVFQAFHLLPHLTLARNIALPLVLAREPRASALARAGALLRAVGLGGRDEHYPGELSGGELQRVAIARALVHKPSLILADEPTGNLDPETGEMILDLFRTQVQELGAAAVIVTHSERAAAIAHRTLTLSSSGLRPRDAT